MFYWLKHKIELNATGLEPVSGNDSAAPHCQGITQTDHVYHFVIHSKCQIKYCFARLN